MYGYEVKQIVGRIENMAFDAESTVDACVAELTAAGMPTQVACALVATIIALRPMPTGAAIDNRVTVIRGPGS